MWKNAVHPNVLSGRVFVSILRCGNLFVSMDSGDLKVKVRLGRWLMRNAMVKMASPHRYLGTFIVNIRTRATSNKCLFFLSETPFYVVCQHTSFNEQFPYVINNLPR